MTSPSRHNSRLQQRGFTLIEVMMVILLVTIVSVVSITVIPDTINESRFNHTVEMMNQIRNAMIGNPEIREGSARSSFGYLGDVGTFPPGPTIVEGIAGLLTVGAIAPYAVNSTARF